MKKRTICLIALIGALSAKAIPSVEIDSVVQRWPWNNKVDITYTVADGQDLVNGTYYKLVFTVTVNGQVYTIDGVFDIGASANTGTHTITWTAPSGIKPTTFTTSAAIYDHDAPSGDDYMVVDLATGKVAYEGLLASQDASNQRYNTALYKTDKMVLRKVAAGGTYPTGDNVKFPSKNSERTWTTDRDYYIGVFMVTQAQYKKIMGTNPSACVSEIEGDVVAHRPVEHISWNSIRGMSGITPNEPVVANAGGGFFPRLNAKTKMGFDLPTEVMFEIAARAGATTAYSWGTDIDYNYIVYYGNTQSSSLAVGSRYPNAWGLFDTAGNMWEWIRDGQGNPNGVSDPTNANMANKHDPWTCSEGDTKHVRLRGGVSYAETTDANAKEYSRASYRNEATGSVTGSSSISFRAALVKEP